VLRRLLLRLRRPCLHEPLNRPLVTLHRQECIAAAGHSLGLRRLRTLL